MAITIKVEIDQIITDFELETVQSLANDMRVAEVAQKAGINVRTMENRVGRMKAKYGCNTITGLCVFFFKNGWIK